MSTVQFDPKIATDLQIDWRRPSSGQASDPFADLLAKHRLDEDDGDSDARRRHLASDPVSGRPPRVAIAHARTIRGEAKEVKDSDDHKLSGHAKDAGDDDRSTDPEVEKTAREPKESLADTDTPKQDKPDATGAEAAPQAATDQPAPGDVKQAQACDPAAVVVVPTQAADQKSVDGKVEMAALPAIPAPAEGQPAAPEQIGDKAKASPDGTQKKEASQPEQQAVAAAVQADLTEAVATLSTDQTAVPAGSSPVPAITIQATAPHDTPATREKPLLQALQVPAAADVAPSPAAKAQTERPLTEPKVRPATPTHANARTPDPTPSSESAAVPQAVAQRQQILLQPASALEFGTSSDMLDQPLSDDASGFGWATHLAQGAASRRADFVAQLRQHLQNLPAHEQVAVHVQRALREGTGKVSIQLSPAELGRIHVKLEIDEDKRVTAAVTVERPSTLELLQRDMKGLERALHNAGLNMDGSDLSFSLGHRGDQDFAQDWNQSAASAGLASAQSAQSENSELGSVAAQVTDTAAGVVDLQV